MSRRVIGYVVPVAWPNADPMPVYDRSPLFKAAGLSDLVPGQVYAWAGELYRAVAR